MKKLIGLVNRKGGVGKTTSAGYLAMALHTHGQIVTGVDTDGERGWLKWHAACTLPYQVISSDAETLREDVEALEGFVVIDTPPNNAEIIYKVAALADEIIVPLAPTGLDVNRLVSTLKLIAEVEQMRSKPLASVLLVRWHPNLLISRDMETQLQERNYPLLETKIRDLTRYEAFTIPSYLEEYERVLKELKVI